MGKVLIVTWAPIIPQNMGYNRSVFGRVQEETENGNNVLIFQVEYCDVEKNKIIKYALNDKISIVHLKMKNLSLNENLMSVLSFSSREEYIYSKPSIKKEFDRVVFDFKPDVIQVESIWALPIIGDINCTYKKLVIHDVINNFYISDIKSNPKIAQKLNSIVKLLKSKLFEKISIEKYKIDEYVFLTKEDETWYQKLFDGKLKTSLASNKLDVKPITREFDKADVFFLYPGSIEFSQNYLAIKWFIKEVGPKLNSRIKLLITGAATEKSKKKISKMQSIHNVIFSGEVTQEELETLNRKCLAVLSPIISGSGIKIKILEATQRGIPVIATKKSSRGIYSELCISTEDDTPEKFAKVMNKMLNDIK